MYWLALPLFTAAATVNSAVDDPVRTCRARHAADPSAHIACLESALRAPADAPSPVPGNASNASDAAKVAAATATAAQQTVRIVGVRYDRENRGVFTTDAGAVWREIEVSPRGARLDAGRSHAARLERSIAGGYRLYVDGVRRMLKVERVE